MSCRQNQKKSLLFLYFARENPKTRVFLAASSSHSPGNAEPEIQWSEKFKAERKCQRLRIVTQHKCAVHRKTPLSPQLPHAATQKVRGMIELVMGQYMGKYEAVEYLFDQAAIDPLYTRAVWMMLEEKNKDFFKAYYKRVLLKKQAAMFNSQVEQHLEVMKMIELVQSESKQIENNSLPVDDNCTWKSEIMAMGDTSTHERINGSSPQRDLPPMEENVEINGSAGLKNGSEDVYEGEDGLNVKELAEVAFTFPELSACTMSTIFSDEEESGDVEEAYYAI